MYELHYKYISVKYDSHTKLLFTSPGRLVYKIETDDFYEYFYEDKSLFNFSDYPKDLRFYDPVK